MSHHYRNGRWAILSAAVALILCIGLAPVRGAGMPMSAKKAKVAPAATGTIEIPANLSPEEVDAFLAGLDDRQVREVLALRLKEQAAANAPTAAQRTGIAGLFDRTHQNISKMVTQLGVILSAAAHPVGGWSAVVAKLTEGGALALIMLYLVLAVAGGVLAEKLFLRSIDGLRRQLLESVSPGHVRKAGRIFSRILLDIFGVLVFILASFLAFELFFGGQQPGYKIGLPVMVVLYYFRIIVFFARVLFSPSAPELRLAPMSDENARFLHRWIVTITAVAGFFAALSLMLKDVGVNKSIFLLVYSWAGIAVSVMLLIMIWQGRRKVSDAICPPECREANKNGTTSLRAKFAAGWHWFATVYVVAIGIYWAGAVLTGGKVTILKLIYSLFLIPIFIAVDQWLHRLLQIASGESMEVIDLSGDDAEKEEREALQEAVRGQSKLAIHNYVPLIRNTSRIVLIAFLFFIISRLWGINLPLAQLLTGKVLDILITLLLGFIFWQFVKARIDKKLKEELPDEEEEMEEGGAGGSRIATLLLLLKKFILAVLVIMVSLIVLSSMGIDIGPLIAGAGVVGLAIGFGAQTLVKDIIAGIFFLVDDAFRVGDYVSAGGAKGMVEHISLRSVKLRHPRGPVYTIPFGSLGSVQNMSRDYIITKLDFRVKYDTDVDKVRKIIKKINKKLAKDPEISKVLLGKVKSQGIRELDDSAMIMRVKFKTLPGEQFVVRRHVFQMMQQAFRDAGIEFAHRNVTVYLPPEQIQQVASGSEQPAQPQAASPRETAAGDGAKDSGTDMPTEKKGAGPSPEQLAKLEAAAGAAAATVIQADEAAKQEGEKK